jgi:hypothetical protein
MNEENIAVLGPGGFGTMHNTMKNNAFQIIGGKVLASYFNDLWVSRNKNSNYMVINDKGGLAGYAILNRLNPYFTKVELIGSRKQGVGTKIMQAVKNNAKAAGSFAIELNAIDGAEGFYKKLGFKTIGKTMTNRGTINTHQMILNLREPVAFTLGKRTSPKKPTPQRRTRRTPATRRTPTATTTTATVGVRRRRSSPTPTRSVRQKK